MSHLGIHGYVELQVWPYCLWKIQHIWHFPLVRRTSKPALHHCHPVLSQCSCLQCTGPTGITQMTQQNMIAEMIAAERCCSDLMLGISLDGTAMVSMSVWQSHASDMQVASSRWLVGNQS